MKSDKKHPDSLLIIHRNFSKQLRNFKSDKVEKVLAKLNEYVTRLSNPDHSRGKGKIFKPLKGTESIFKFQLKNGDRVLFTKEKRRIVNGIDTGRDTQIALFRYVNHDEQGRVGKSINDSQEEFSDDDFEIVTLSEDTDDPKADDIDEKLGNELCNNKYLRELVIVNESILSKSGGVEFDEELCLLIDDQLKIVDNDNIKLLQGFAGSGKTTVSVYKFFRIAQNETTACIKYLTPSAILAKKVEKLFRRICEIHQVEVKVDTNAFQTVNAFFGDYCKLAPDIKLIDFEKFEKEWYNVYCKLPQLQKTEPSKLWMEIRENIKGFALDEVDFNSDICKSSHRPLISENSYLESNKQSFIRPDILDKQDIYELSKNYNKWLSKKSYIDENDLAFRAYCQNQSDPMQLAYVVVDEVQDFTEFQLRVIRSLLKDENQLFFCGDPYQRLSMNHDKFESLKRIVNPDGNSKDDPYHHLSFNFRNSGRIHNLIAKLNELREGWFGKRGGSNPVNHRDEEFDDTPILLEDKSENMNLLYEMVHEFSYSAIIVPNEKVRLKFYSKIKEKKEDDRVYLIHECKGLEFKQLVCYDFCKAYPNAWKRIRESDKKTNQKSGHEYYLNQLYVAISRAIERLVIIDDLPHKALEKCVEQVKKINEKELNWEGKNDPDEWLGDAQDNENNGKYHQAITSYKKCIKILKSEDAFKELQFKAQWGIVRCEAQLAETPQEAICKISTALDNDSENPDSKVKPLLLKFLQEIDCKSAELYVACLFAPQNFLQYTDFGLNVLKDQSIPTLLRDMLLKKYYEQKKEEYLGKIKDAKTKIDTIVEVLKS